MEPRKVVLTLEIMTDKPIRDLRKKVNLYLGISYSPDTPAEGLEIVQVQANVVKGERN